MSDHATLHDVTAPPLVAHLIRTWIAPSETFIEGQVVGSARSRPLVVARHERPGARTRLGARPLWLTTEGLSAPAQFVADLAYRVRRLSSREASGMAARLAAAGVDLIHAHFGTDAAFFAPVWRQLDVPLVVSFYGYDAVKAARRFGGLGRRHLQSVIEAFDAFVVPSQDMAQDVRALGAPAERVVVLPWGIDVERFRPPAAGGSLASASATSTAPAAAARPLRAVAVCRFIEKKGLADALAAFAAAHAAGAASELTLAGEGPLRAALVGQARALGIAEQVRFAGFVAPSELPDFLRQHDLFLHPSVTPADGDKEGVPTSILEAAASGLPILATRHGGIPEAVEEGVTGHLVAEHDVAALTARFVELARDPQRRAAMGAAGRARIRERFDAVRQNARREQLYFDLLRAERAAKGH